MSLRAITLGLSLALLVAGFTYFNDFVIRQTGFIHNFLPVSVFGLLLVGAFLVNPVLGLLGRTPLRPGEFMIIAALALAACPWPGSNFWRYTGAFVSSPNRQYPLNPAWRAQGMMSFIPDASPKVAPAQVRDAKALAQRIIVADEAGDDADLVARLWRLTDDAGRAALAAAAADPEPDHHTQAGIAAALNAALASPRLTAPADPAEAPDTAAASAYDTLARNRGALDAAFPDLIHPRPPGGPVLLGHGDPADPAAEALLLGIKAQEGRAIPDPRLLPWGDLLPSVGLWVAAALGLGLASLLIAVVVHPQWSGRELLAYPIPRFLREVTARGEGQWLPTVARSPLFWTAAGVVFVIHVINGLHIWFPQMIDIPLTFDLKPLRDLVPGVSKIAMNEAVFFPRLFFTVVGFAYFLPRSVSFSLGISMVLWLALGVLLLPWGINMPYDKFAPSHTNALRLGSYLAMLGVILYFGRRYYLDVFRAAVGVPGTSSVPSPSVIWSARLLPLVLVGTVYVLTLSGLDWLLATLLVGVCLLVLVVFSRVVCETGAFLMSGPFMPAAVLVGLLGYDAIGPTGFAMLAFAGFLMIGDPREAVMPYIASGLEMVQQHDRRLIGRASLLIAGVLIGAMLVAGLVTLTLQSQHTVLGRDNYATNRASVAMFDHGLPLLLQAREHGTLDRAIEVQGLERIALMRPDANTLPWLMLGAALVIGCAVARMRLPGWPLHPAIFLIWGTWGIRHFAFSFFLGWAVKAAIIHASGLGGFARGKPIMVGLIAGELAAGLGWIVVGVVWYFSTGKIPESVSVMP